jgi:O-antigen chain-terminating methyltransferase
VAAGPEDRRTPSVDAFLGEPTHDLSDWRWLWSGDREFPIHSHRGVLGKALVFFKRLLRPFVKVPQNDLWERQRVFNIVLLDEILTRIREEDHRAGLHDHRIATLEEFLKDGLDEIMRHNDALFARVDQKLDRYRREARELLSSLGAALAKVETDAAGAGPILHRAVEEGDYLELERRFRGTEAEIEERLAVYLPHLRDRQPVLDLGCGRGESLRVLAGQGIEARGVDGNAEMVAHCRGLGLTVEEANLFEHLAALPAGSLGAVVSFHVIEHLPPASLNRLIRLAFRALRPGGVLILETPNPLSMVVATRRFWIDPTHQRPVHPETLQLLFEVAGFASPQILPLRPFPEAERLPQIDPAAIPTDQRPLADSINRLRDQLDDLLFGDQDFAVLGFRP